MCEQIHSKSQEEEVKQRNILWCCTKILLLDVKIQNFHHSKDSMVQHSFSTLEAPQMNTEIKETLSKLKLKKNKFKKKSRKQENIFKCLKPVIKGKVRQNKGTLEVLLALRIYTTRLWQRRFIRPYNRSFQTSRPFIEVILGQAEVIIAFLQKYFNWKIANTMIRK